MKVIVSDITTVQDVDYICNASSAWGCQFLSAGVSGAISRKAGFTFQIETLTTCIKEAPKSGGIYITSAGKLPYKAVIHLVTMWMPGMNSNIKSIESCLQSLLLYCRKHAVDKVALPALGTGTGGLDYKKVAEVYSSVLVDTDFIVADINRDFIEYLNSKMAQG